MQDFYIIVKSKMVGRTDTQEVVRTGLDGPMILKLKIVNFPNGSLKE